MLSHGPVVDGDPAIGTAATRIRWDVSPTEHEGKCYIGPVKVTLELVYTLPDLKTDSFRQTGLMKGWKAFSNKVEVPEHTHGDISKDYAGRIRKALIKLKPEATCEALKGSADKTAGKIYIELARAQEAVDRREMKRRVQDYRDRPKNQGVTTTPFGQ
jgi:predicted secreted Zn-dependent protease